MNWQYHRLISNLLVALFFSLSLSSVAKADSFHLVTAPFKPFTDPDHPKGGFLVEVARQALALRGHELKVDYRPWARAMSDAKNGRYDGLLSAFYNEERGKVFHFSAPLNTTKMMFVGRRDQNTPERYGNFSELKDYIIGVGRKWAYCEEFEQNKDLQKSTVNDEPSGIRMLFNKRIDLFAVNIDQYKNTINLMGEFDVHDTIILEPAISTNDQHIAAPRALATSEIFLSEFNTGLAALKANGGYQKIKIRFFGF